MSEPAPFRTPQLFPYYNTAGEFIRPTDPPPVPAAVSRLTRITSYGIEVIDQSAPAPAPTPTPPTPSAPRRRTRRAP